MRAVVIGANGQLGNDLVKIISGWDIVGLTHSDLDIRDLVRARAVLCQLKPDAVINTAAFNRVDDCEDDPDKAFSANAYGARNLARVCADSDCALMHISTDYVFGGEQVSPYTEDDAPNPLSVYGVSKLAGEYFVRNICPKHFIVRTSGLYGLAGSSGKGGNFVETMIRLAGAGNPIRVVEIRYLTPHLYKRLGAATQRTGANSSLRPLSHHQSRAMFLGRVRGPDFLVSRAQAGFRSDDNQGFWRQGPASSLFGFGAGEAQAAWDRRSTLVGRRSQALFDREGTSAELAICPDTSRLNIRPIYLLPWRPIHHCPRLDLFERCSDPDFGGTRMMTNRASTS